MHAETAAQDQVMTSRLADLVFRNA